MSPIISKSLQEIIEDYRQMLLDLSLRNRLLNYDITKNNNANKLVFTSPNFIDVYRKLVSDKAKVGLKIKDDKINGFDFHFKQEKANTTLLGLHKKGNTILQEQGYNALYVANYFLKYLMNPDRLIYNATCTITR